MALDSIVRGTNWEALVTVQPGDGETTATVTAALTGGTVAVLLYFGAVLAATGAGVVIDPSARTVEISFLNGPTGAIPNLGKHKLDVRLTTLGAKIFPIKLDEVTVQVKDIAE